MEHKITKQIVDPNEKKKMEMQMLLAKEKELKKQVDAGPRANDKDYTTHEKKEEELKALKKTITEKKDILDRATPAMGVEEGKLRVSEIKEKIDEKREKNKSQDRKNEETGQKIADKTAEAVGDKQEEINDGTYEIAKDQLPDKIDDLYETNGKPGKENISPLRTMEEVEKERAKKAQEEINEEFGTARTRSGGKQIMEEEWNERQAEFEAKRTKDGSKGEKLAEGKGQSDKNEKFAALNQAKADLEELRIKYENKKNENSGFLRRFRDVLGAKTVFLGQAKQEEEILQQHLEAKENEVKGMENSFNKEFEPVLAEGEKEEPVEHKFESQFGIKKEDLEKIGGFNELSQGQKLLVLENLKQSTLGRIQEEASDSFQKETIEAGFLKKVWKNISKKYQIAKLEKSTAKEIMSGGIAVHGETLKQLIEGAKNGPEAVEKNGKVEINFISKKSFDHLDKQDQELIEKFNEKATEFGKIPYEWSLETATKEQREKYGDAEREFNIILLNGIMELKNRKGGEADPAQSFLYVNDLRKNVLLNQFLNTNPEVEKELYKIRNEGILKNALKNVITERGIYAGAGFLTRTATTSLLGLVGVPLAAAGMGGFLARKRAKESLVEKEKGARKGKVEEKLVLINGKLEETNKEAKEFADASGYVEILETLIEGIKSEPAGTPKKEEMIRSLQFNLNDLDKKLNDGTVNFGKKETRLANQYSLISKISEGQIVAYMESGNYDANKLVEDYLANKEISVEQEKETKVAQNKYVRNQTIRGAVLGAGFASAGWLIRHYIAGEPLENITGGKNKAEGQLTMPEEKDKTGIVITDRRNSLDRIATKYFREKGMSPEDAAQKGKLLADEYAKNHGLAMGGLTRVEPGAEIDFSQDGSKIDYVGKPKTGIVPESKGQEPGPYDSKTATKKSEVVAHIKQPEALKPPAPYGTPKNPWSEDTPSPKTSSPEKPLSVLPDDARSGASNKISESATPKNLKVKPSSVSFASAENPNEDIPPGNATAESAANQEISSGKKLVVEKSGRGRLGGSFEGIIKKDLIGENIDRKTAGDNAHLMRLDFDKYIDQLKREGKIPKNFSLHKIQPGAEIEVSPEGKVVGFKDGPGGKFAGRIRIENGHATITGQETSGSRPALEENKGNIKSPRGYKAEGPNAARVEENISKNIDLKAHPEKFVDHYNNEFKNIAGLNKQLEEISRSEQVQNMSMDDIREKISIFERDIAKNTDPAKIKELKDMKSAMEELALRRTKLGEAMVKMYYDMAKNLYSGNPEIKGFEAMKGVNAQEFFQKNASGNFRKMLEAIANEKGIGKDFVSPKGGENMSAWTRRVLTRLLEAKGIDMPKILGSPSGITGTV